MTYSKKEDGLTLIELLATLTLFMVLCGLFYGALNNVFKTNKKIQHKISAQQEANYILSAWTTMHQKSQEYTISYVNDTTVQLIDKNDPSKNVKLGNNNYMLFLTVSDGKKTQNKVIKYPVIPPSHKDTYLKHTNGNTETTTFTFNETKNISLNGSHAQTKIHVELTAVNKSDSNDSFTIATTISRMTKAKKETG